MVNKTPLSYREQCAVRLIRAARNSETVFLLSNSTGWNWNQRDPSRRWIYVNIFRLTCVKLRIRLENFKCVFARVWFNIAMTSAFLSLQLRPTKLFVDSTPVKEIVSQVVTWPAATRVFLPTTKGGREEREWERGWRDCRRMMTPRKILIFLFQLQCTMGRHSFFLDPLPPYLRTQTHRHLNLLTNVSEGQVHSSGYNPEWTT